MSVTVGMREFRQDLADFIDQTEPVTVTRHGQTVGLFIPARRDRSSDIASYSDVAKKASALLERLGVTKDDVGAELDAMRTERREQQTKASVAS